MSGPRSARAWGRCRAGARQQSSTFFNRIPSTATSQNRGLTFVLQHWLSSMTTQVLVCQLFASYYLQTCSPCFCIAWSSGALVFSGTKLQCRSWPGLDRVSGFRAAHTWKWPRCCPDGSHWLQELLESAAPCRSSSLALFPVLAQWAAVGTRVTGPYGLGKRHLGKTDIWACDAPAAWQEWPGSMLSCGKAHLLFSAFWRISGK